VAHILKWNTPQMLADQKAKDYQLRFWLKDAELFSYLPSGLDPKEPDLARLGG
jgi:hypothetical protein